MSGNRRLLIGVAGIVAVVAAFLIAHSSSSDSAPSTTGNKVIVITNAKPVGGVQKLTVKKGGRVTFTVKSDTADEIHVHGYNFHKDVEKGGSVSFDFPATISGEFVHRAREPRRADRVARGEIVKRRALTCALLAGPAAALLFPTPALAHGIVGRTDLPIPVWLFGWAAAVVLIVSFVALGSLWPTARLQEVTLRPLFRLPVAVDVVLGIVGVVAFGAVVYAAWPACRMRSATWPRPSSTCSSGSASWLRACCSGTSSGCSARGARLPGPPPGPSRKVSRREPPPVLEYPAWLGRWPAAIGHPRLRLRRAGLPQPRRPLAARDHGAHLRRGDARRHGLVRHRHLERARRSVRRLLRPLRTAVRVHASRRPAPAAPAPVRRPAARALAGHDRPAVRGDRLHHLRRRLERPRLAVDSAPHRVGLQPHRRGSRERSSSGRRSWGSSRAC